MRYTKAITCILPVILLLSACNKNEEPEPAKHQITYTGIPMPGFPITFSTNAAEGETFTWDIGDVGPSVVKTTYTHTFLENKTYIISMHDKTGKHLEDTIHLAISDDALVFGFEGKTRKWKYISRNYTYSGGTKYQEYPDEVFEIKRKGKIFSSPTISVIADSSTTTITEEAIIIDYHYGLHASNKLVYTKANDSISVSYSNGDIGGSQFYLYTTYPK